MSEFDIEEARVRYRILKHLDDHNNLHPFVSLERDELLKELNLEETMLEKSVRYLEDRMLVETVWFMGGDFWTKVSQDGIDELFQMEKDPLKRTRNFPSYYKLQ